MEQSNPSRRLAIVAFEDAAEFAFASETTFRLRDEVVVQEGVISPHTAMGSLFMVILQPDMNDVIELSSAEADEMIQHFSFCAGDKALCEGVCFGSLGRSPNTSYVRLPESIELVGIFSVAIPDEKPGLDALILHPH